MRQVCVSGQQVGQPYFKRVCVCVCGSIYFVCVCVYNWDDCEDHFIVRGIEEVGKDR